MNDLLNEDVIDEAKNVNDDCLRLGGYKTD